MSARQLIVLGVAFIAAIGALFVIRGMASPREEAPQAAEQPISGEMVLVYARDVTQGAPLATNDMAWRLFPEDSVGQQFIKQKDQPEALTQMQGGVTRRAAVAGEPVIAGQIVLPDGRGFMAATLQPGYRAVSIEVEANTSAGGFIQPNDRVDVLVTRKVDGGAVETAQTRVVLEDVRVIALDEHTSAQNGGDGPERITASIAVLELSQQDATLLASADRSGKISLALRPVEAETAGMRTPSAAPRTQAGGGTGGIVIHAFGRAGGAS
ncbi:MAG: Flp pilus assembly protein CpaB [Caulobacterales bacterium]